MQRIILASGSKTRKLVLEILGLYFDVIPSDFDEQSITEPNHAKRAEMLARKKAESVAEEHKGIIIAADTFEALENGEILEKPKDIKEARWMLEAQSGSRAIGYTGFCYIDTERAINHSETSITKILFREWSDKEIEAYIDKYPVLDWAAAFNAFDMYGMGMIAHLEGSTTGWTYAMPTDILVPLLRQSGLDVHP